MSKMFSVDDETLIVRKNGKRFGSVYLVYGSDGADVIADHSMTLDALMTNANKLAEKFQ